MALVCVDTHILSWSLLGGGNNVDRHLVTRAKHFMDHLGKQGDDVLLPSIVVAEVLAAVPPANAPAVLASFRSNWQIAPFDVRAAAQFGRMWQDNPVQEIMRELRRDPLYSRRVLSADLKIAATAISCNADRLYSHDSGLRNLTNPYIPAEDFLSVPVQSTLFGPEQGDGQ